MDFIDLPSYIDGNVEGVEPSASVILASGIPWDNTYKHVRPFSSRDELLSYVRTHSVYTTDSSVTVKEGTYEYKAKIESAKAQDINYIAWKNTPYDHRWHFGFVTQVTWKSRNTTSIRFELDVFQECWYSTSIKPCFVKRHHIPKSEDSIGANLVPDDIETGVLECYKHENIPFGDMYIGLYVTELPKSSVDPPTANHVFNGVYSGLISLSYPLSEWETVQSLIDMYDEEGKNDAIVLIYMYPEICRINAEGDKPTTKIYNSDPVLNYGYSPKNKKLFTYPYSYVVSDDNSGNVNKYFFEYFTRNIVSFRFTGLRNTLPSVYTRPNGYRGNMDFGESFITNNFPVCAWSSDTFKAYVAQNKNSIALGIMSQTGGIIKNAFAGAAIGGIPGLATGAATGAVSSAISVANTVATLLDKELVPEQARGKVQSESVNTGMGLNRIDFYFVRPKLNMCKRIDSYWNVFGYPVNEVTIPNINTRSSWNYLQTIDCGFTAQAELTILSRYRKIFDDGVFLWHTNDIGNFNLENN